MEEIQKLIEFIKDKGYDYKIINREYTTYDNQFCKGLQVRIEGLDFSAIWHYGSYGYEKGLIEVMCKCNYYDNSVIGNLTAKECINILENYEVLEKLSKERNVEIEKCVNNVIKFYDTQIANIIQGENNVKD